MSSPTPGHTSHQSTTLVTSFISYILTYASLYRKEVLRPSGNAWALCWVQRGHDIHDEQPHLCPGQYGHAQQRHSSGNVLRNYNTYKGSISPGEHGHVQRGHVVRHRPLPEHGFWPRVEGEAGGLLGDMPLCCHEHARGGIVDFNLLSSFPNNIITRT